MARLTLSVMAFVAGLAAIGWALLSPVHMRAVDEQILRAIGSGTPGVVEIGSDYLPEKVGIARLLQEAAEKMALTNGPRFGSAIRVVEKNGTGWRTSPFKTASFYELLDPADFPFLGENTFYEVLRNRVTRWKFRDAVSSPEGLTVLKTLGMTNTVLFAPASSAAGMPMEIAVVTTAMLVDEKVLSTGVREGLATSVAAVNSTNQNAALEEFYLNVFALAKRFSWEQMVAFAAAFQAPNNLDFAVRWLQENKEDTATLFAAVLSSQNGDEAARYLRAYPETGMRNISAALSHGGKALTQLLAWQTPIYRSEFRDNLLQKRFFGALFAPLLNVTLVSPGLAMLLKIALLFFGAFLISIAWRVYRSSAQEEYVWFPRFGVIRQSVFALLFVTALLVLAEPYLAYGESKPEPPRPAFNFALVAEILSPKPEPTGSMLNPSTIVALVVFFLLQASIYIICLTKLAEIRKQPLSSTMKLKLLDNEENLFDAGLYAGLFGTALSLVLLTLGVIKPSLVSAYAATLFGILFVAILKIAHVRPYKRRLILEAQSEPKAA